MHNEILSRRIRKVERSRRWKLWQRAHRNRRGWWWVSVCDHRCHDRPLRWDQLRCCGRRHHSATTHKRHARYQSYLVNANTCNGFVTSSSRSSQKSRNDFETTVTCVYDTVCPTLPGKTPIRYMQTDPHQTRNAARTMGRSFCAMWITSCCGVWCLFVYTIQIAP